LRAAAVPRAASGAHAARGGMVIPIGGGGDPDLGGAPFFGPPSPELLRRFKKIKVCLIMLIFALIVKLVAGILLEPSNAFIVVQSCLNIPLETFIGIFLLKDDALFRPIHRCIVGTCCSSCRDQCQGGISCLCYWFITCLLFALSGLLPVEGSDISQIYVGIRLIVDPNFHSDAKWYFPARSVPWYATLSVYVVGMFIALVCQIVGAWQGFKGFQGLDPMAGGEGAGAEQGVLPADHGGSPDMAGAGAGQPLGGAVRQQAMAPASQPGARAGGFAPFSGQGQRLGG